MLSMVALWGGYGKGVLLSSLASIPFALYRIHVSKKIKI
ncbi:hypothetical protein LEP1GSC150_1247 [Leptospira interrogans serovar Copenhageni str. LT2050]|uniref:Uncharacterized protein n=1 Tax=Leptospira interrogans serovar Copenhageni str. LT2050 TaxID=1001598 RepID=M3HA58_LEPIT|nr:hypothetical protein LEP1GSC150_1247 [Leptospira interrogans serovar Copenhageni str. LT2050]